MAFGIIMFLWFNRESLKRKWWLYRHPQSVLKVIFLYPNKMFIEKFVHVTSDTFEFDGGTYNVKKDAILRKNWFGFGGNQNFDINESNCLDFKDYKV